MAEWKNVQEQNTSRNKTMNWRICLSVDGEKHSIPFKYEQQQLKNQHSSSELYGTKPSILVSFFYELVRSAHAFDGTLCTSQ